MSAETDADLTGYASAVRRLLAHGGFERTGDAVEARRWGIDHIRTYLDLRERPDRRPTVHVAGSKGKGSVAAITEALLREAGEHTLLLTSPDLHGARERIAIDGQALDHATFARLASVLLDEPACAGWSYFELLTVMGWLAGAEAGCERQVLEVGLGGRLDTTNAVDGKDVAIITPIDLEHTEILGDTIEAIAEEKAGVITSACDVVLAPMRESAARVVRRRAADQGAVTHEVAQECAMHIGRQSFDGQTIDLKTPLQTYRGVQTPLVGRHQAENIACAVRAAELALARRGGELGEQAVKGALHDLRLPGRFDVVRRRPMVILDGLHTPLAARRFREALDASGVPRHRTWVLGMLSGKAVDGIVAALVQEGETVIVAPPPSPRAADPADVVRSVRGRGAIPQRRRDIAEAVDAALTQSDERGAIIIAGSLYTVAAAREHLLGVAGDHALGLR